LADPGPAGQDRFVTEARSPLDAALDLLIYAPVGFALTAAEEIPKLAAKGRAQVEGQVAMARVVGQFAVTQGRKELAKRFAAGDAAGGPARPRPTGPDAGRRAPDTDAGPQPGAGEIDFDDLLARPEDEDQPMEAGGDPGAGAPGPGAGAAGAAPAEEPAASPGGLGIPGYDSLAASQVVQRLAGLSAEELAAVGAYESAHRARRTILTRVDQLRISESPPAPNETT
jgi:hypothetical protein